MLSEHIADELLLTQVPMATKQDGSSEITVREAARADLPGILDIFNERIQNSTAIFYYDPKNLEERQEWWLDLKQNGYPVIVALHKDEERPVGYASLSVFQSRPAYKTTATLTVYVHQKYQRKGIGRILANEVLRISKEMNIKSIVASITSSNDASIGLLRDLGFQHVGTFHDSGFKFGEFHDVHFYEFVHKDVVCKTERAEFRSFPWGKYSYKEPLFED